MSSNLAGAEVELVQLDHPRLGAEFAGGFQGMIEQMVRAREARVGGVHRRRRNAGKPQRPRRPLDLARQRMRFVRRLVALAAGVKVDQDAAVLDLDRIGRNAVFLETGLAQAAAAVEFPIVPGADDIVAVQPAVAERSADVVAGIRNRAEFSILERYRELAVLRRDALERRLGKLIRLLPMSTQFSSPAMVIPHRRFDGHLIAAGVPGGNGRGSTSTMPRLIRTR